MGKEKLKRYQEVVTFEHVIDLSGLRPGDQAEMRSSWKEEIFGNNAPVTAELGCGKGDYSLALARRFPERNFVGIDIKGDRLWKAAQQAAEEQPENLRLVRGRVDHITQIFGPAELDEIWITFPDPHLKFRRRTRRMTAPGFLERYRKVLAPGALLHLKTDSAELFEFTLETLAKEGLSGNIEQRIEDVYALDPPPELLRIRTYYEQKHLQEGRTIKYLRFTL